MPRFVRPAWVQGHATGRKTAIGFGPSSKDGYLRLDLTLRTPQGGVSRSIDIIAGAFNDKGDADATITIPNGFMVESEHLYDGATSLRIVPVS